MRKLVFALALLAFAAPARAELFTLSTVNVNLHTTDPGLVMNWNNLVTAPVSFALNSVGQSFSTAVFRVGTAETALNWDDLIPYSIVASLGFTAPPPGFGGGVNGISGAGWLFHGFGYVVWNNPVILNFGSTGQLAVYLSAATFGLPGSATVTATFKLLQANSGSPSPVSVPEPTSLALLTSAVVAAAFARRRIFPAHRR
jgi:hypothetical protein